MKMNLEEFLASLSNEQLQALLNALVAEDMEYTEIYDAALLLAEIRGFANNERV